VTKYGKTYLVVHVDDMLLSFPSPSIREWFEASMKKWYELAIQYKNITYLGMSVNKTADGILVHQSGYIETLADKFLADKDSISSSPTGANFLEENEKDVSINTTKYLGLIMSLMYLARYTRPDVLMPVTYLATKSANPTQGHYNKAMKILSYVVGRLGRCSSQLELTSN
jgi:hypothetical protein